MGILYMNTTAEQLDRLQKLQNAACRVILLTDARTHIVDMHDQLSMTNLEYRRYLHLAIFVFRVLKGLIVSNQLAYMFEPVHLRHAVTTRANVGNDLVIPKDENSV